MASPRVLIAVPAYNEEASIAAVVGRIRRELAGHDLVVVQDGSRDGTGEVLRALGVATATHRCNLGYGRALQTALKLALAEGYDLLVTLDADGQHRPEDVRALLAESESGAWDLLIGSRYVTTKQYRGTVFGRRVGMQIFSILVGLISGQRIYDTTSGLKVIRRRVFEPLARWHFVDFHAEAIVYLLRLGYRVGEHPVTVDERRTGSSMYASIFTALEYPLKTLLMLLLGIVEASLARRSREAA